MQVITSGPNVEENKIKQAMIKLITSVEKEIMLTGTANADYRSFALNFEISAILYDKVFARKYFEVVDKDIKNSVKLDMKYYVKKTRYNNFGK